MSIIRSFVPLQYTTYTRIFSTFVDGSYISFFIGRCRRWGRSQQQEEPGCPGKQDLSAAEGIHPFTQYLIWLFVVLLAQTCSLDCPDRSVHPPGRNSWDSGDSINSITATKRSIWWITRVLLILGNSKRTKPIYIRHNKCCPLSSVRKYHCAPLPLKRGATLQLSSRNNIYHK